MNKIFKFILLTYLGINLFNFSFGNDNFFNEGLELYKNEKYEEARFMFERSIIFNPKDSKSYLYFKVSLGSFPAFLIGTNGTLNLLASKKPNKKPLLSIPTMASILKFFNLSAKESIILFKSEAV